MPVRPPLAANRRTAIGVALAGLGATGCRLDRSADPAGPATGSTSASPGGGSPAPRDPDPDTALVAEVLVELADLTLLTAAIARRFPALREPARELGRLHRAHREALGEEVVPDDQGVGPRPRDAAAALAVLRSRELRTQRRLADWSVAAQSGALARLLASMSAGVAQHVTTLPRRAARRGER